MKFKIIELEQKGSNLHVAITHEKCVRQVFSLPIDYYDNDKYLEEIKKLLEEMYSEDKIKTIDKSNLNKEFDTQVKLKEIKEGRTPKEPKEVKNVAK